MGAARAEADEGRFVLPTQAADSERPMGGAQPVLRPVPDPRLDHLSVVGKAEQPHARPLPFGRPSLLCQG